MAGIGAISKIIEIVIRARNTTQAETSAARAGVAGLNRETQQSVAVNRNLTSELGHAKKAMMLYGGAIIGAEAAAAVAIGTYVKLIQTSRQLVGEYDAMTLSIRLNESAMAKANAVTLLAGAIAQQSAGRLRALDTVVGALTAGVKGLGAVIASGVVGITSMLSSGFVEDFAEIIDTLTLSREGSQIVAKWKALGEGVSTAFRQIGEEIAKARIKEGIDGVLASLDRMDQMLASHEERRLDALQSLLFGTPIAGAAGKHSGRGLQVEASKGRSKSSPILDLFPVDEVRKRTNEMTEIMRGFADSIASNLDGAIDGTGEALGRAVVFHENFAKMAGNIWKSFIVSTIALVFKLIAVMAIAAILTSFIPGMGGKFSSAAFKDIFKALAGGGGGGGGGDSGSRAAPLLSRRTMGPSINIGSIQMGFGTQTEVDRLISGLSRAMGARTALQGA